MNLLSTPFRENLGDQVNCRSQKKAKIVVIVSLGNARVRTGSMFQYDPNLCSEACSYTELSIWEKTWAMKIRFRSMKKLKI